MPSLHLSLLGPIQIALDTKPVTAITSPKIEALLAYLVMEQKRAHSRGSLSELLWPGQETGRQNLRKSFSRLQKALPQPGDAVPFFLATRQDLRFQPNSPHLLDVARLRRGIANARNHTHDSVTGCDECAQALSEVAALYRGDFLTGLDADSPDFDEWMGVERTQLQREVLWALEQLTDYHAGQGAWAEARRTARRQIQINPVGEVGHRQLMNALALDGRRADALTHYESLASLLAAELDAPPSPATTALYNDLRSSDLAVPTLRRSDAPTPRRTDAPTPRRTVAPPHNLPAQTTPFIGRTADLTQIHRRLSQPDCRLLTLLGPGGVGKSRLAVEVGQQLLTRGGDLFSDGIWFVSLAPLDQPQQVVDAIASTLRFFFPAAAQTPAARQQALITFLTRKRMLLVLDNWEHLLPVSGWLSELLAQAQGVQILATSRQPLGLRAEWLHDLGGLPTGDDESLGEAEQLFAQIAQRARSQWTLQPPDRAWVQTICRTVEGFPLAVELAAAQIRAKSLEQIALDLHTSLDRLAVSFPDMPPRHRSLRAAFDSSWALLTQEQQQALAQLALFRNPFRPASAHALLNVGPDRGGELVRQLVERSLIRPVGQGRYLLHEVLRTFAEEKLSPPRREATLARHAAHFCAVLAESAPLLAGPQMLERLEMLRQEEEELHRAWRWAVDVREWPGPAAALSGFQRFHLLTSHFAEMEEAVAYAAQAGPPDDFGPRLTVAQAAVYNQTGRYDRAVESAETGLAQLRERSAPPEQIAQALIELGYAVSSQTQHDEAREIMSRALEIARVHELPLIEIDSLRNLGVMHQMESDYEAARQLHERALIVCRQVGDIHREASSLVNLGILYEHIGEYETGVTYLQRGAERFHATGNRRGEAAALHNLSSIHSEWGHLQRSQELAAKALEIFREIGEEYGVALALNGMGADLWQLGRFEESEQANLEARLLFQRMGDQHDESLTLTGLGFVAGKLGEFDQAYALLDEAASLSAQTKSVRFQAAAQVNKAFFLFQQGRHNQAREEAQTALSLAEDGSNRSVLISGQMVLGRIHLSQGAPDRAEAAFRAGLAHSQEDDALVMRLELLAGLAEAQLAQKRRADAAETLGPILPLLLDAEQPLGTTDLMQVYLSAHRVMKAAGDAKAAQLIQIARDRLTAWADGITDPQRRRSMLENVPSHRAVSGLNVSSP